MASEIGFPVTTEPGRNPTESGGRLINAQAEYAPSGSRSKYIWRPTCGLAVATDAGSADHRGVLKLNDTIIAINDDEVWSITKAGAVYSTAQITGDPVGGTGRVIMARNMRATPQIIVVTDSGMSKIESSAAADFSDADLPQPNSVCFKDGYFFFGIGDGRCFASAINDVTVSSLDWTRAESSPDGLMRVFPFPNGIVLAGENSTELFSNTAEATGFPFSRAAVLPFGLYASGAVTGFEEGFTGDPLMVDNEGKVRVIVGLSSSVISTGYIETLINQIEDRDTLTAGSYVVNGQPVYVLSCDDWTLEFSPESNSAPAHWRERKSIGSDRWRAGFFANAFNEWLAFDNAGNAALKIDPRARYEDTDQIVWELRSTQAHRFPGRGVVHRVSLDFLTGVGNDTGIDPIETEPTVEISWSDDGGQSFGSPLFRELGTQGELRTITVNRTGMTGPRGRQYKLRVSDPVQVAFYGGVHEIEGRA